MSDTERDIYEWLTIKHNLYSERYAVLFRHLVDHVPLDERQAAIANLTAQGKIYRYTDGTLWPVKGA